jgi:two-component system sensor histidine kinase YesM
MAESKRTGQVVELVSALSRFFRISLSKGKDWISVGEELEHVGSYLAIQKIRYRDILDYSIDVDDAILDATILKLTLQPLVENALYHGIKNKRNGGSIRVHGTKTADGSLLMVVEDSGIGMSAEQVAQIEATLAADALVEGRESGYGLYNVNQRVRLYYGRQYGLSIHSQPQRGTRVELVLPLRCKEFEQEA